MRQRAVRHPCEWPRQRRSRPPHRSTPQHSSPRPLQPIHAGAAEPGHLLDRTDSIAVQRNLVTHPSDFPHASLLASSLRVCRINQCDPTVAAHSIRRTLTTCMSFTRSLKRCEFRHQGTNRRISRTGPDRSRSPRCVSSMLGRFRFRFTGRGPRLLRIEPQLLARARRPISRYLPCRGRADTWKWGAWLGPTVAARS